METLGELNKFSTRGQKDDKSFLLGDEMICCRDVSEDDESYIDEVKNLRIPTTVFSAMLRSIVLNLQPGILVIN